jgi:CRP-like cAMP-binding protein
VTIVPLKDKARTALLEGKYKKALEYYLQLHEADRSDLRVYAKLAELREKTGDIPAAVRDYLAIAKAYADQGFVVQAIAINKIVLRLDPSQHRVRTHLKALSRERGEGWAISTMSVTAADDAKRHAGPARTPLLSELSGEEMEAFVESLQPLSVAADELIYREGDAGSQLYLIGTGSVRLQAKDASGREHAFSALGEGDFFGERAFMSRARHHETAIAETDCALLMVDRPTFDAWVMKHPGIQATVEDFYRQRILARVLAITPVFEGVPPDARMALAARFHLKRFDPGQTVVTEGHQGDSFYLIRSGSILVTTHGMDPQGGEVTLGSMHEGDFFGEVALLTDKPRTATVVAEGPLELMELSRDDFNDIVTHYPSVRRVVQAYQKQRVQHTIRTLMQQKPG